MLEPFPSWSDLVSPPIYWDICSYFDDLFTLIWSTHPKLRHLCAQKTGPQWLWWSLTSRFEGGVGWLPCESLLHSCRHTFYQKTPQIWINQNWLYWGWTGDLPREIVLLFLLCDKALQMLTTSPKVNKQMGHTVCISSPFSLLPQSPDARKVKVRRWAKMDWGAFKLLLTSLTPGFETQPCVSGVEVSSLFSFLQITDH